MTHYEDMMSSGMTQGYLLKILILGAEGQRVKAEGEDEEGRAKPRPPI